MPDHTTPDHTTPDQPTNENRAPEYVSFGGAPRRRFGSSWPSGWRRWAAIGLIAGLAVGGAGVAIAASEPSPSPTNPSAPSAPSQPQERRLRLGPGWKGWFGALHGEFVVPRAGGGYETVAMQRGEVTGVSESEITVRSEDGFSKTYAVTGETSVNGGRDGIGSVARGDQVSVLATVAGGRYTAVKVVDVADARRPFERWGPRRDGPQARSGTPTPS
jgi:hypothetical protein